MRRLTEKARLLGYEVEVGIAGTTEARRKIAPNLTIEFVNYFNGRYIQLVKKSGVYDIICLQHA